MDGFDTPTYSHPRSALLHLLAVGVALGGAACSRGGEAQNPPAATGGRPAIPVAVTPVAQRDLARHVTLTGPVEPVRTIGVNSRASGTVLDVAVIEGDRVRAGTVMAELDARETTAQLERARAILAGAESAFRRAEQMHASQITTNEEFERARREFETARSDVALWETRLDFTTVAAPSSGVVTVKYIEAGSAVSPNQRLFDIADDALKVVRVQMSELDVVHVNPGDAVTVELDAYPAIALRGAVRRVFPSADPRTRLVPVEVALDAVARGVEVRPGFLARVRFALEGRPGTMVAPASAIGTSATGPFVYVVAGDTLERRAVRTGLTSEGFVEILGGLEVQELVVSSGHLNLRQGAPVRVSGEGATAVSEQESRR